MKRNIDEEIDAFARKSPELEAYLERCRSLPPEQRIIHDAKVAVFDHKRGVKLKTKGDCKVFVKHWIQHYNKPVDRTPLRNQEDNLVESLWAKVKDRKKWRMACDMELIEQLVLEDIEVLRMLSK